MPFDRHDLLRQTGYAEGDFIPLVSWGRENNQTQTVSSTSFQNSGPIINVRHNFDDLWPTGLTVYAVLVGRSVPGTDETHTIRVRDLANNITIVETTGFTSSTDFTTGPSQIDRSAVTGNSNMIAQHKTEPAMNSSDYQMASLLLGVIP